MRKKKSIIIATVKTWNISNALNLKSRLKNRYHIVIITKKDRLNYDAVKKINPEYIFFPHWSWIIPMNVHKNFKCIGFHMTDLPFGRGGSPLQNLIVRRIYRTKISAISITSGIDSGPVYLKKPLSLSGSAQDIFKNASRTVFGQMIPQILKGGLVPRRQKGKVVRFARRTHSQGSIFDLRSMADVYDYIRMLDAQGYPPAFIETRFLKIEFSNACLKKGHIVATAKIKENK